MKNQKWLTISVALALAVVLLAAAAAPAQMRGKGQWGQGWGCAPAQGQGQGPGSANCPYYQGSQNYRPDGTANPGAAPSRRGPRGTGRNYQPNTQPTPPPATQ